MTVYLIHSETKLHHAQHYLGSAKDVEARLRQHRKGAQAGGAKLLHAMNQAGIAWRVVRTWDGGRRLEKQFKRQHNGPRFCPICQARS